MTRAAWKDFTWRLIDADREPAAMHMALDEVLTARVGQGLRAPTLRVWDWEERAVVLGRTQSVVNEIDEEALARHGMRLVRRMSGGGTMFIVPANTITWSVYAPVSLVEGMSFVDSYAYLDAFAVEALRSLGVDARYVPINDIASPRGKIAGAAQSRFGRAVLHHTTMAYDIDEGAMREVIRLGKPRRSSVGTPSANKRVDPLRRQLSATREEVIARMLEVFRARYGLEADRLTEGERSDARALADGKYSSEEWLRTVS